MQSVGIIPARYNSTRFPGKPLAMIGHKSMLQRVFERCSLSSLSQVVIATDDDRIREHAENLGARVIMTSPDHKTGTDRIAEALSHLEQKFDIAVNIQGDEPFIDPSQINLLIKSFKDNKVQIATLIEKPEDTEQLFSPNTIKVVADHDHYAMYFSRSPIPFIRGKEQSDWLKTGDFYKHIGIYAFRAEVLKEVVQLPQHPLELSESLEQLRWLANGYKIKTILTRYNGTSVDTPEDLEKANELLNTVYM